MALWRLRVKEDMGVEGRRNWRVYYFIARRRATWLIWGYVMGRDGVTGLTRVEVERLWFGLLG